MTYIIKHNKKHFISFLVDILLKKFSKYSNPVITIHVSPPNIPLDVAMATFPPVCLPETNLCAQELLRDRLCKWILTLNCTASLCRKCVNSYYYSGASPVFSSLCLQHSHITTVPSGACVITVLMQLGCMHYTASEAEVQPVENTSAQPIKTELLHIFTLRNDCTCCQGAFKKQIL